MAADTAKHWSIREDGFLSVDTNVDRLTYNSSLNSIIITCKDQTVTVLDALSGAFLQKSDLSGHKKGRIECAYLPEKDKTVFCDGLALGVRGDLQGILLLDTALQTAVSKTEDFVKIELPLAEATHLLKTLASTDLRTKDNVDDFEKVLGQGIHKAEAATQGNHKTAKWATVTLQMQHMAIRSVCSALMEELTKSNQTGQGFPVASAIVDRLGFLLPSSRLDIMKEPVNRALMYSEAARRETFANWPHMNYKWALPEPMAQAGFFHHPNLHGDDRAMCFTCNVCLVCWEPTDEPWSEHERHSQLCPYIKGDYTQNVPLTVTYATQPAQCHDDQEQQKIACLSTTLNEDFIATSTTSGNITVWDISYILKKHCQFDIDLGNALVALTTGLHIENSDLENDQVPSRNQAENSETSENLAEDKCSRDKPSTQGPHRPSLDLCVTSLCVADETKWREEGLSPNPSKPVSPGSAQLSLFCGVTLRCAKPPGMLRSKDCKGFSSRKNETVQLMNEVNEAVSGDSPSISELITESSLSSKSEFLVPHGRLAPYIVVVSLVEEKSASCQSSPLKKSTPPITKPSTNKDDMAVPVGEHSNSMDYWSVNSWEDGLDPDCQIVGFSPPPGKSPSSSFLGMMMEGAKYIQELHKNDVPNGPSDLCDSVDTIPEPSSPDKRFFFCDYPDAGLSAPGKEPSVTSFHNIASSGANSGSSIPVTNEFPNKVQVNFSGAVIQCLELPCEFQKEQIEVQSILPSIDKQHVILILSMKVGFLESTNFSILAPDASSSNALAPDFCGGGILVYRLRSENCRLVLEDVPVLTYQVSSPKDVITSTFLLPPEVEDQVEDGGLSQSPDNQGLPCVTGHLVLTTASGVLKIMSLAKLSTVAEISPGPSEKYICATYCSGVERLSACTDNGKLKFFDLDTVNNRRCSWNSPDPIDGLVLNGEASACKKAKMDEDVVDHSGPDYLINQPLNGVTLKQLHQLIQFENLMPRFTAVVPPCWSEIQQEQQQRRHPQHLQQQGESTQHTRTWKLTTDASGQTWDEHLFEILLPKPCSVGHVDIKFSLHPMCTLQPNVEITLLKQNIGSIFCPPNHNPGVKDGQNNNLKEGQQKGAAANCDSVQDPDEPVILNTVLDPKFLKTHNAEILCGPVKLANCLDLTGSGGLITLSSPQLLSSKPRSLLLHIKGFENSPVSDPILINKEKAETDRSSTLDKKMKFKKKTLKGLFDSVAQGSAEKNSAAERQKLTDVKGCDWFQELSVTVRVFKKTNVKAEKQQRHSMITDNGFHKRLIELLTPSNQCVIKGVSPDHLHCMALDILIWALAVQMNDVEKRRCEKPMLEAIQSELKSMVKTCFILGSRTTAHKFSRLLAMCMESSKYSLDRDVAPAFSYAVMQALLACYPLLPHCSSSGALRWFFILLNRAKCMDVEMVAQKSCELLLQVSKHYYKRTHHLQALLKTRYGLYGNPFEAELFDLEHSNVTKPQAALSGTTPGAIFTNGLKGPSNSGNGSSAGSKDQTDLFDLLTSEKNFKTQPDCLRSDILGLLEVEPLHFRCHATSDGTRMERMDASSTLHGAVAASTFNTGLSQLALQGFGVEDMPGDLCSYMAAKKLDPPLPQIPPPIQPPLMLSDDIMLKKKSHLHSSKMYGGTKLLKPEHNTLTTELQVQKTKSQPQTKSAASKAFAFPQMQGLLQSPPPQVLVIERMHSGARRFVTLDFGKRIVLTDVVIPSSMDLASLSIDVWVEKEEVDGQRLVVASDIGHRTLVMNNIMPAPVCRYLKITTVGRYSGGTTRSRIPLGSFYGHTYILPWELPNLSASSFSAAKNQNGPSFSAKDSVKAERGEASKEAKETGKINSEGGNSCEMTSHSGLLSQLALFLSLLEDLQCRFNLARTRLESLLTVVGNAQFLSSHVQYHLKRNTSGKLNEEDAQIIQAYNECLQLQVQLNLAQHAIRRLQTSLGLCVDVIDESVSPDVMLEQTSTDKLRVILESLLDTLLTSTVGSPAIPQPPAALYTALTPVAAQTLFQHLCIHSPQRVQVSAGLLLVRVCGTQPWWGHFLGNIMQEFFHAHFSQVFPQDRVFLLLSAMGQKSLCGPSAVQILDSLLAMLSTILSPLTRSPETDASALPAGNLDLSLISWVLLFLCRNMEGSSTLSNADDGEKNGKRDKEGGMFNNRWGFIESQWSSSGTGAHGKSQRVYRRGLQKRVALYKEKLDKMKILSGSDKKNLFNSKYTLKRNQLLIKLANDKTRGEASHDAEDDELEVEPLIMLSRERCLSVARGLMALLLSMDFTCHVDLFLITCKVLAKICVACRPSVSLTEAMTQEQLEQLVLLVVDTEFNHNSMSWGGPWAAHAITCLLQDILEGKKSGSSSPEGSETELADADDSLVYARWMEREGSMLCTEHVQDNKKVRVIPYENVRSILRNKPEFHEFVKRDFLDGTFCLDEKDNPAALVLLILNKNDKDKVRWNKFLETVTKNQAKGIHQAKPGTSLDVHKDIQNFIMDCFSYPLPSDFSIESFMYDSPGSSVASGSSNWVDALKIAQSKSIQSGSLKHLLNLKNKLTEHMAAASGISLHLSTALDARLEFGLETMPEHRLKMMQSVQLGNVHCAFTLPLPQCPAGSVQSFDENHVQTSMAEEMAEREQSLSSVEMLSTCFEHMFARLRSGRVSLESVLQLWLTLNEDHLPNEEGGASSSASASSRVQHFDATRQPIITLSENAVASLIEVGVMMPSLMIRTWVFLLQSLCLLTNQRHISSQGVEVSLAPAVLRDANLAPLITKFLCSHPPGGSGSAGSQLYQVGPAAVKILGHLLHRLQCKSIEVNGQRFKEMLLKIVYNLIADRGAIYQCSGPIDAQVQFLEMMSESPLLSVDVSNALSVIQAASTLVYQHLSSQDQVVCHTSHDTSLGAQSCFGGLVASLLRGNDSRPGGTDSLRDQLMFFLLQLVNKLISAPMNSMIRSGGKSSGGECSSGDNINHKSANRKPTWADPPIEGNRYTPRLLTNIRLSDDEKSRTRNQQGSDFQSQDQQQHQDREAEEEDEGQHTVSEIADIVAGHPVIMQNLIQSLSHCTSNKLALMFAHTDCLNSLQKSVDHTEAVTVGDLIFTILRNLKEKCSDRNVMVDNLYHFFAEHPSVMSQLALTRLSEPLLFYTLRILNSSSAIKRFIALGGVNVVGSNLVRCSQQMISSSPSIISTLMQNFSSGHTDLGDKNKGLEVDNTDGLQSFAQLGTITCSSPTAVPADGLIQMVASRRARSATWSYHFYPDEPSVELTIQLPFAVLLKYVHIKPHAAAISSCPSHVSLELSHDGNVVTPTSPPLLTSSLTLIRLQLQKPQVVTSVTLLLHRPLDSTTIGLQRISLWGQTAFAESAESPLSIEDGFSRSSLGWMRILHHCLLNSNDELQNAVAQTAAQTPNLMSTCTSLLLHPVIGLHAAKIETILVRLGLSHKDISLTLLDNILRQPSNPSIHPVVAPAMSYLGKVHGIASPYTVEIIYRLGTTQDENTHERVAALLHWLEDCARSSLTQAQDVHPARNGNRSFGSYSVGLGDNTLCNPSPEHVQCIAAVLWYSMELPVTYPLHRLVNVDSIRLLFDWSRLLQEGNLRKAVNNVLCSACYICPNGFMHIQEWMGIVGADGSQIVAPTDNEESSEQREAMSPGRMTDDSKEATKLPTSSPLLYSTDGMTDDSKEARRLQSFSTMNLDESKLMMLSAVCKSPAAIRQLMTSGLPAMLAQAVCEFCNQQMLLMASLGCAAEGLLGGDTTSLTGIVSESSITATLVSAILRFFTEISSETELKDWLGHAEGNAFWSLLLTLLCGSQYQAPAILNSPNSEALG
ncbi:baculoviral iap repeat-containing protein 6, partial [Plakobranchus ocellatus]